MSLRDDLVTSDATMGTRIAFGGCVDASHTIAMHERIGHTGTGGLDAAWHFRDCAKKLRATWLATLKGK